MPVPAHPATDSTPITTRAPAPTAFDPVDLNDLIPPPLSPWRKLGVASILVALAGTWLVLFVGGYIVPQAPNHGSFHASGLVYVDQAEGLVAIRIYVPNSSNRDIRLTGVTLDAPGADVAGVSVAWRTDAEVGTTTSDGDGVSAPVQGVPAEEFFAVPKTVPLPVVLPAQNDSATSDAYQEVVVWIRPTECADQTAPWGSVELTVDFGEGAFPPISRTYRSEESVWTGGQVNMWGGDDFVDAAGPLALACAVLQ